MQNLTAVQKLCAIGGIGCAFMLIAIILYIIYSPFIGLIIFAIGMIWCIVCIIRIEWMVYRGKQAGWW